MNDNSNLTAVISAYRKIIYERYDYHLVKSSYSIPDSLTEEKFNELRTYFLTHIYPPSEQRAQLNTAFDNLEEHISNPKYLLNILMDSVGILFKYGLHLPKMLRTGLKAMQSFKTANRFEQQLATAADASDRKAPYSKDDIEYFTSLLARSEVDGFVNDSLSLFDVLHDRQLIKRIIDIVNHLIFKMLAKPSVYPPEEVAALKLGRNLIVEGDQLFESLTRKEQDLLFDMVVKIERDVLDRIFAKS